ncbi:MAG: T9SS type A sorting domain-containing protein [bacterium]
MKTNFYLFVLILLCSSLFAQKTTNNNSICGTIDELPEEIIEIHGIGGWINTAADDGAGNIFISQSNLVHNAVLSYPVEINSSTQILGEARSITYENGRVVCSYFVWPETNKTTISTFVPGSKADVENFQYAALSGINGIFRIVLKNGYLYVAELGDFLDAKKIFIFDWTGGPNSNGPVGTYNPGNASIYDFAVDDNVIYVAGDFNGTDKLVTINTTNKSNPVESASIAIENITCVGFDNGFIYAGCKSDVSNDGLKVLLRTDPATIYLERFRALQDFDKMIIKGNKLYARNWGEVIVIDITPTGGVPGVDPQIIGKGTFNLIDFEIWGVSNNKIYFTSDGKFGTIDVSNLANIVLSGELLCPRVTVDHDINNHSMVVIDDLGDIFSYSFTDPEDMTLVSTGNVAGAQKVFIYEGQCFIANDTKEIKIFDLIDLTNEVGHYQSIATATANFIDMTFSSAACYAVGGQNLEIFSRTEDVAPGAQWPRKPLAQVELGAQAFAVSPVKINNISVAHGNGISTYFIETLTNPTLVNTIPISGTAVGLGYDGDYLIALSTEGGSTYLSSYNANANPPTLLKKQLISNTEAGSETEGKLMAMVDGLILLVIQNQVLSFVYLPETNEFAAGATFVDENPFYNIKAYRQTQTSNAAIQYDNQNPTGQIVAGASQKSPGVKKLKISNQTIVSVTMDHGVLTVTTSFGLPVVVGANSEGYITVDGHTVTDQNGKKIPSGSVEGVIVRSDRHSPKKFKGKFLTTPAIERNSDITFENITLIDLSGISTEHFPNILASKEDEPTTIEHDPVYNILVDCEFENTQVIASRLGTYVTTYTGDDILYGNNESHCYLNAGNGNNTIYFGYNDYVFTGLGNDCLNKLPVNTSGNLSKDNLPLLFNNAVPDSIFDEGGIDTLNFSGDDLDHTINLDLYGVPQVVDETGWTIILDGQFEYFYGGAENDKITVKPLDVPRFIDGGGSGKGVDTIIVDKMGLNAVDDGNTITIEGYAPITYSNFTQVILADLTDVEDNPVLPNEFKLYQNYPNPFNPTTTIKYSIPGVKTPYMASLQHVTLKVYDMLGREMVTLVNEIQNPGTYQVKFNATGLASGLYICRLETQHYREAKKLMLLK